MRKKAPVKKYTQSDFERFMNANQTNEIHNGQSKITRPYNKGYQYGLDTEYHIEKGVPIPEYSQISKFPLLDMEIGDSFVAPLVDKKALTNAITRIHKRNQTYKFITRTVTGRGRTGKQTRVWRIKPV